MWVVNSKLFLFISPHLLGIRATVPVRDVYMIVTHPDVTQRTNEKRAR
jgi:hypothetical protein